ncbi:hypothetical protein VFPPC_18029 [Pochonia chlamydosporia 170]|uniref:Uncharacterized protein n=1 Tax=Pochonia chlamydosporia 170 TaxID=1380566 RepID=A0A219AR35_METCM|nr:hypothetical protein VFPPC_18029 [Pochonia chlamydosporia 170]OWT42774.1 hypothetical protein VFPPC_18029 [Pochonia chlamydosporia 170]
MQLFRSNHNCRAFSDAIVNSLGRVRGPDLPPADEVNREKEQGLAFMLWCYLHRQCSLSVFLSPSTPCRQKNLSSGFTHSGITRRHASQTSNTTKLLISITWMPLRLGALDNCFRPSFGPTTGNAIRTWLCKVLSM